MGGSEGIDLEAADACTCSGEVIFMSLFVGWGSVDYIKDAFFDSVKSVFFVWFRVLVDSLITVELDDLPVLLSLLI